MINIFYNPNYIKTKKVLITKNFKYSILYNFLIDIAYFFNFSISDNLLSSGPHKRMNNLIKTFKNDKNFVFNKIKFTNSYIVQFDDFGKSTIEKLITNFKDKNKILVGPLYNLKSLMELSQLIKQYSFIKIVVASEVGKNNLLYEMGLDINPNNIVVFPSGVIGKNKLNNQIHYKKEFDCIVYFKKRKENELSQVLKYLEEAQLTYKLFRYGLFKNSNLITSASKSCFAILITGTESQGFATQELMSTNTPLIVWNKTINEYENYKLSGTSVPYFSDDCGVKVDNFLELKKQIDLFKNNNNSYKPAKFVLENLTYEKYKENLMNEFLKF